MSSEESKVASANAASDSESCEEWSSSSEDGEAEAHLQTNSRFCSAAGCGELDKVKFFASRQPVNEKVVDTQPPGSVLIML